MLKCIGALPAIANRKINERSIPIKLQMEPDNQYNSKAIALVCKVYNNWERIGYVVQEVFDKVHEFEAISNRKIHISCVI